MKRPKPIEVDFNEALRRIAHTPKSSIPDKKVVNSKKVHYNDKEALKKPPPVNRKTD